MFESLAICIAFLHARFLAESDLGYVSSFVLNRRTTVETVDGSGYSDGNVPS